MPVLQPPGGCYNEIEPLQNRERMGTDRILIVDDDPDNRAMVGHFLTHWGFAVDDPMVSLRFFLHFRTELRNMG